MRTERPVGSTGTGLQEAVLRGDDHPRRTTVTVQLTDAHLAALQVQARAEHRPAKDVAADAVREYTARFRAARPGPGRHRARGGALCRGSARAGQR
jgi:hypothetical protein